MSVRAQIAITVVALGLTYALLVAGALYGMRTLP